MFATHSPKALARCLRDAGCSEAQIACFLRCDACGNTGEQLTLLAAQRDVLLDKLHRCHKQIDCLDYLIYQIERQNIE